MDEIDDFNFSIQFAISGNIVQPILYIGQNPPPAEYVGEMLKRLNTAGYVSETIKLLQEYGDEVPKYKQYLENVIACWVELSKQAIEENSLQDNELVVKPTQFIKYKGYTSDEE